METAACQRHQLLHAIKLGRVDLRSVEHLSVRSMARVVFPLARRMVFGVAGAKPQSPQDQSEIQCRHQSVRLYLMQQSDVAALHLHLPRFALKREALKDSAYSLANSMR